MFESILNELEPIEKNRASLGFQLRQKFTSLTDQLARGFKRLPKTSKTLTNSFNTNLSPKKKMLLGVLIVVGLILGIGGGVGFYTYRVAQQLKFSLTQTEVTVRAVADQFKSQNLPGAKAEYEKISGQIDTMEAQLNQLVFLSHLPISSKYWQDGQAIIRAARSGEVAGDKFITTIEPYSDVLGLSGTVQDPNSANAENRIKLLLETLEKSLPELDSIAAELTVVSSELSSINPDDYPEQLAGQPLRSRVVQIQNTANMASSLLSEFRPVIEQIPNVAGASGARKKYLVLFQNDNELRPTGGFLTAYSIIYIEDGKVTPDYSDDIYELDQKYRSRTPIPEQLGKYLTTERYWNLRDMNISPDFRTSMEQFFPEFQKVGAKDLDGIIAVDTEVLTRLLNIIGPVNVPGYGTFTSEPTPKCDCPQVVYALSEIITRPTNYIREDRKGILGPLMREVLTKVYDAPSDKNSALFQVAIDLLAGKHVQFYFPEEQLQTAAETANVAGRMITPDSSTSADFFAVVNSNLGGAKSNLFINYEIEQGVMRENEQSISKTVEITYKNNHKADNCNLEAGLLCLNSTLRDWTRIYVPAGSKLIESTGFIEEPSTYDEAGFTVFDGFFTLEPDSVAKLKLTYSVPYTDQDYYRLQVWKQSGVVKFPLILDLNGDQSQYEIMGDKVIELEF